PLTVNFTDASTSYDGIISWFWEFGDGTNSTEQSPTHDYAQEGVYTVSLTVTEADTDSDVETKLGYITVLNTDPIAEFSAIPQIGFKPLTVNFTDLSSSYDGIISWFWEFGDGTNSTEQNPTHIYLQDGVYNVSLTVTEADSDSDTETKIGYIIVGTEADLVGKSAWPEHHHFVLSKDGNPAADDKHGTPGKQTIYAKVGNTGTLNLSTGTYKVVWDIVNQDDIPVGSYETVGTLELAPGDQTTLTYDLNVSTFDGKYSVTARCWYHGLAGDKIKSFGFAVVP
ncbi:PKD domain-containing protein, partial [Halobacteriota archaeon]